MYGDTPYLDVTVKGIAVINTALWYGRNNA
jgi:hypothetical protein